LLHVLVAQEFLEHKAEHNNCRMRGTEPGCDRFQSSAKSLVNNLLTSERDGSHRHYRIACIKFVLALRRAVPTNEIRMRDFGEAYTLI